MADFQDFIKEVKQANDIVDVIGSYIELRQGGQNYWARCPFQGERTPSFAVKRNGQFFHCFSCHESGDVIKFVEKYESCTFYEALEILAKRANLKMPETARRTNDDALESKKRKRDLCFSILRESAVFYWKCFYSSIGQSARQYMQNRGFTSDTLKKFGVGYSPDTDSLVRYLTQKGFKESDCVDAGVLQRNSRGSCFDALFGRLIIPIFDVNGRVIAFGGRALDEEKAKYGKYKNTSETPLFLKKNNLYAINIAKQQKQQAALPNVVVVEGYMDVISMYQAGFYRCVASMGTSLTEQQARLISRLTSTVYICYDGDSAGQKATIRGMDILAAEGLEVFVMSVPEKLDPDEYIKKYGGEAFEKLIENALPLADYKLKVLEERFPLTAGPNRNSNLAHFVKGAVEMLVAVTDPDARTRYVEEVSAKTSYSAEYINRRVDERMSGKEVQVNSVPSSDTAYDKALQFVAAALLNNRPYAVLKEKPVCDGRFIQKIFDYVLQCKESGEKPSIDMIYTVCPDASPEEYDKIICYDFAPENDESDKKFYRDCALTLEKERLQRLRKQLLTQVETDGDALKKVEEINKQLDKLYEE